MIWRKTKSAWRALGLGQLKSRAAAYAALRERMPGYRRRFRPRGAGVLPRRDGICKIRPAFNEIWPVGKQISGESVSR